MKTERCANPIQQPNETSIPKRLIILAAHPDAPAPDYENDWIDGRLNYITTNKRILTQCTRALDNENEWIYVQRMQFNSCRSRIIGRVKVARSDEEAMRVWFEEWEDYDAVPQPSYGGSYYGHFSE